MKTVNVPLKTNAYKIVIGKNILTQLGAKLKALNIGKDAVIITNPVINKCHGRKLIAGLKRSGFSVKIIEVPAGERSKSARCAVRLIEDIARYDRMKKVFVIAFGGGVVGDLAGYVAAVYKRGIPYIQVPTTLLAQVDSAIGGKVGIDLSVGKNLAGAFHQPKLVYSDVSVLSTLPIRQIRNGLAEVVKYGVIADKKFFQYVQAHFTALLKRDPKTLETIVERCSRIKRDVVVIDERETKGVRAILNFGHTIGHAIEAAGNYSGYHHGESITLGMRVAAHISFQKRLCKAWDVAALNALLTSMGLPQRIEKVKTASILSHMKHDKKFHSGKNRFVLMTKIGKVKILEGISTAMIKKAIASIR